MRPWNQSQGRASDVLEHRDTYGQAQVCSKGPQRRVARSAVFLLYQVWHVRNTLPQGIRLRLSVSVRYLATQHP